MPPSLPWGIWLGPIAAMFGFVGVGAWLVKGHIAPGRDRRTATARFDRWSWLWLIVYDATWLASATLWWQAALIAGLFVIAWGAMMLGPLLGWTTDPRPTYRV